MNRPTDRAGGVVDGSADVEAKAAARNRFDTLARVATAVHRHLAVSYPEKLPVSLPPTGPGTSRAEFGAG